MSKFKDALDSHGKLPLSEALEDLRAHVKIKDGKASFSAPQDLEADTAKMLHESVEVFNDLIAKGLVKVDSHGKAEV